MNIHEFQLLLEHCVMDYGYDVRYLTLTSSSVVCTWWQV